MEWILAAAVIGLMGSLHCMGMCGPIAFMLHSRVPGSAWAHTVLYNTGRITTYALLGAIAAAIGQRIAMAGLQQVLSIVSGLLILLILLLNAGRKVKWVNVIYEPVATFIRRSMSRILPKPTVPGFYLAGMVNGLLPCGLVYLALAAALNTPGIAEGAVFMAVFGLGTFPAMIFAGMAGRFMNLQRRLKLRRLLPWFTAAVAVLLIVRGLDLGIPYVSPHTSTQGQVMDCCSQPMVH